MSPPVFGHPEGDIGFYQYQLEIAHRSKPSLFETVYPERGWGSGGKGEGSRDALAPSLCTKDVKQIFDLSRFCEVNQRFAFACFRIPMIPCVEGVLRRFLPSCLHASQDDGFEGALRTSSNLRFQ